MPSLLEAHKLSSRAAQVGFDWPDIEGSVRASSPKRPRTSPAVARISRSRSAPRRPRASPVPVARAIPEDLRARLEEEVGDLFFVLVNIARYLALDPESALRKTNRKFRRRFQWMEDRLHESGTHSRASVSMDELESLWQQAKQQEKQS